MSMHGRAVGCCIEARRFLGLIAKLVAWRLGLSSRAALDRLADLVTA
jgi:hypothetical protein